MQVMQCASLRRTVHPHSVMSGDDNPPLQAQEKDPYEPLMSVDSLGVRERTRPGGTDCSCSPCRSDNRAPSCMSGLDSPRGLAFGPEGALYVTEAGRGAGVVASPATDPRCYPRAAGRVAVLWAPRAPSAACGGACRHGSRPGCHRRRCPTAPEGPDPRISCSHRVRPSSMGRSGRRSPARTSRSGLKTTRWSAVASR